ncbi:MAG TPA: hypothetical protein VKD66_20045 [Streptosporangiaceae bacterium]|nr:hypothetical protein [Streptosporangiaceae bacterium]
MMPPSLPPGHRAPALPFVINSSKFEAAFGPFETTPHPDAVRRTIDWYRSR